jgi:hypothetical protein
MAQVHMYCSHSNGRLLDRRVAEVDDLFDAHEQAEAVARSLIASPDLQDWRNFRVRVWDELGEEVFMMPFSSIIGKPH